MQLNISAGRGKTLTLFAKSNNMKQLYVTCMTVLSKHMWKYSSLSIQTSAGNRMRSTFPLHRSDFRTASSQLPQSGEAHCKIHHQHPPMPSLMASFKLYINFFKFLLWYLFLHCLWNHCKCAISINIQHTVEIHQAWQSSSSPFSSSCLALSSRLPVPPHNQRARMALWKQSEHRHCLRNNW